MIVVPFLSAFAKKTPLCAHATAILIILPVSLVSAVLYLVNGYFDTELFLSVCMGVTFGGVLGARALNLMSGERQRCFLPQLCFRRVYACSFDRFRRRR